MFPIISHLLFRRDQFVHHVHISEISLMCVVGTVGAQRCHKTYWDAVATGTFH